MSSRITPVIDHGHQWIIYPQMSWPPFILSAKGVWGGALHLTDIEPLLSACLLLAWH